MDNKLYFTIGLPRSGKSHLADQWVRYEMDIIDNLFQPYIREELCPDPHSETLRVVICSDDIRLALHGCRWSSVAEESVHSIQGVMIRSLLLRGFDVLVDGTHTTKSSIERMIRFCPSGVDYVYINTSPEICKKRARETGQKDLCGVIDKMANNLVDLISIECGYTHAFLQSSAFPQKLNQVVKSLIKKYVENPPVNTVVEK